jgi:hypothetical protein
MRYLMGLVFAGGLILGMGRESKAQFGVPIGSPYGMQGLGVSAPAFGYSSGYSGYSGLGLTSYNSGYLGSPRTFGYSSGYVGYAAPYTTYVSGYRPNYGAYGYSGYGYGARGGFRPFRGVGRMFR